MHTRGPQVDLPDDDEGDRSRMPTLADWAKLVIGSARRHVRITASVFVGGLAVLSLYYFTKTPVYRVETKVLAQRQQGPGTSVRPVDDQPTRSAWEIVHRRENLIGLLQSANVIPKDSAAKKAASDAASVANRGGDSAEDPVDAMVRGLDKVLRVETDDRIVTIQIDWPNPEQAYHIVEGALQNFLEARHLQEITAIDEIISLLQGRAATLRDTLDKVVQETSRVVVVRDRDGTQHTVAAQGPPEDLVRLKSMLDAKERAIQDVESFRRTRLADLQAQLDQMKGVYSDAYPGVINLRQEIAALSRESPQMASLREEEQRLRNEYNGRVGQVRPGLVPAAGAPGQATRTRVLEGLPTPQEERLRDARFRYEQMLERVQAAQLELDAARAAFKYRYNVIWPAEMPKKPISPNPVKIFGLGPVLALALALAVAAAYDLWKGLVVERWQVERSLGLPVLADIRRPGKA